MRISERGQITIPKGLRERFGLNHNVEVELTPTEGGLLIHKRTAAQHPVERVYAILESEEGTDAVPPGLDDGNGNWKLEAPSHSPMTSTNG